MQQGDKHTRCSVRVYIATRQESNNYMALKGQYSTRTVFKVRLSGGCLRSNCYISTMSFWFAWCQCRKPWPTMMTSVSLRWMSSLNIRNKLKGHCKTKNHIRHILDAYSIWSIPHSLCSNLSRATVPFKYWFCLLMLVAEPYIQYCIPSHAV